MYNFQKAFTMIELIFVIVILGVLSSVALPTLTATRTDAKISLNNLGVEFATRNAFIIYTKDDANKEVNCFVFDTKIDGNVTVAMIVSADTFCPNNVYDMVKKLASNSILTASGSKKNYQFGGSSIRQ